MTTSQRREPLFAHSWCVGGSLLLTSVIVSASQPAIAFIPAIALQTALFVCALVVFAIGRNARESVTGRRPLGTLALVLLAVWISADLVLTPVLAFGAGDSMPPALATLATADPFVKFGLTLTAVAQIGRANTVPRPWNWAPAGALAALTALWIIALLPAAAIDQPTAQSFTGLLTAVDGVIRVCSTVVLGVAAIVLADRAHRDDRPAAHPIPKVASEIVGAPLLRPSPYHRKDSP